MCSNGKMLSVGYPTAPSKYDRYTNDPPYGNEGGLIPTGFEDSNDDGLNDSGGPGPPRARHWGVVAAARGSLGHRAALHHTWCVACWPLVC